MKRIILTYGTFDLFHIGHLRLLSRDRALGDFLAVGLSTDKFNLSKGKKSVFSYEERHAILNGIRYVDEVFEENEWEQKRADLVRYQATALVMGSDWEGKFDQFSDICKIIYLPRTEGISSTYVKNLLSQEEPRRD